MTKFTKTLKQVQILAIVLVLSLVSIEKAFAAGGYDHDPEETSIAGFTDQASIAIGITTYLAGSTLLASSKIIKSQINKG
jgi:hypothetical protein